MGIDQEGSTERVGQESRSCGMPTKEGVTDMERVDWSRAQLFTPTIPT